MAILDQGYEHWQGSLQGNGWRWLVVARHGVRIGMANRLLRLFVIASQRFGGKTWWIVGEKAGPRSHKYVKTWSFRTRAEAMHLIDTLGRLVEDLGRLP